MTLPEPPRMMAKAIVGIIALIIIIAVLLNLGGLNIGALRIGR